MLGFLFFLLQTCLQTGSQVVKLHWAPDADISCLWDHINVIVASQQGGLCFGHKVPVNYNMELWGRVTGQERGGYYSHSTNSSRVSVKEHWMVMGIDVT